MINIRSCYISGRVNKESPFHNKTKSNEGICIIHQPFFNNAFKKYLPCGK